ncbi:MAG: DUF881 domain-containing protein [Clostridiales bacterium]|nr:DUF881 domain-containing protein [Clostridiales bacterium]
MKKIISQLTVAVVCAILGFMLTYQFQLLRKEKSTNVINPNDSTYNQLTVELEQLKKTKEELEKSNTQLMEQIKAYEESISSPEDSTKELKNQLDKTRLLLGETDVEGQGITLTIAPKDGIFEGEGLYKYSAISHFELAYLINELKYADAEAISVNNTRITSQTGIRLSDGGGRILIDNEQIYPYSTITIKAIGNPDKLESAIMFPNTLNLDGLAGYNIEVVKSDSIKIPKTNKVFKSDYIKPVEK